MLSNSVFRLARPRKKGWMHLLFSRFILIVALLLLQLGLAAGFFFFLREYIPAFAVAMTVFTIGMVLYLFNCPMDVDGKLTWMFLIAVAPVGASLLLFFTRSNTGHRRIRRRVETLVEQTKTAIPQDPTVMEELRAADVNTAALVRYLNRSGCFPAYRHTAAAYLPGGESMLRELLKEIDRAERFIFLEFFILEEGDLWGRVLRKLIEKAKAGVEVRVLYDGTCEISRLPGNYCALLREQGIRAKAFAPIRPIVSSHHNYRDHRKIAVIDGRVAFTGGVNLADEYINGVNLFGHWKDAAVMLRGEAVKSFTLMFLQSWNINEKEPVFAPWLEDAPEAPDAAGFVIPYGDCPLDGDLVGETVYMDILNRARDYVHIMTPYLILDGKMESALCYAAQRGVDVKIILPGRPDKKLAYALAKSHYHTLLEAGVKICEYSPGFVHAKVVVSDAVRAVVGTINLDYRSFYHHFECAAYLLGTDCIADIDEDFQETLMQCRTVTGETMRRERLFYRIVGPLFKFIAPLM